MRGRTGCGRDEEEEEEEEEEEVLGRGRREGQAGVASSG